MTRVSSFAFAAVLALSASGPAMAALDHLGSVDFSYRVDRAAQYGNFGGRVEKLSLHARDSTVQCRDVRATFDNGQTRRIFRGTLPVGRDVTIDLPGGQRMLQRIDFNCHANTRRGATVDISADIGRYQAEWRRSSDWDRVWSRRFSWANVPDNRRNDNPDGWISLGSESFEGGADRETTLPGIRGRQIEKIGLRPTNDDARCRNVTVTFANGQNRRLSVNNGDMLTEDRIYQIDLPGDDRNITRLDLNCHAEHGRQVTIQVMAIDPDRSSDNGRGADNWMSLGSESFEGRADRETTFAGIRGRQIEKIGLRPTDDDARCRNVTVTFANGQRIKLNVNNGDMLAEDRIYQIDLPGDDRNVRRLDLNCHAEHGRRVTIQVMAIDPDRSSDNGRGRR